MQQISKKYRTTIDKVSKNIEQLSSNVRNKYRKLMQTYQKIPIKECKIRVFSDTMLNMRTLLKHVFYCRNTVFFEVPAVRKY